MLRALLVDRAGCNFLCQRLALAPKEHAVFDVFILTLALCAPRSLSSRHRLSFQRDHVGAAFGETHVRCVDGFEWLNEHQSLQAIRKPQFRMQASKAFTTLTVWHLCAPTQFCYFPGE
jgi:hypothetical protein